MNSHSLNKKENKKIWTRSWYQKADIMPLSGVMYIYA